MEPINVSHFLAALGRSSVEAGILVVLVLAAQWLFRRQLTPRWRCALWLLVVARLLLPFSFGSVTSVFNLLPHWTQTQSSSPIATIPAAPAMTLPPAPASLPVNRPETAMNEKPVLSPTPAPATVAAPALVRSTPAAHHRPWSWAACFLGIWLAGVLALAGHVLVSSVRLWRRCARSPALTQPAVAVALADCCRQLKLRTGPVLVECAAVSSPALHGLFRPRLLLPTGFTDRFSPTELRFVFLHELAHLKRRDLWLNWLMAGLQVMHWFNPLVWLGFARWRADRELACDAMALEAAGEGQNREYGRTILRLLENFARPLRAPGLVGILEDKRQLRRRIGMIAGYVPTRKWPLLALLLVGVLAMIGLTDAQTQSKSPKPSTTKPAADRSTMLTATNSRSLKITVLDAETRKPVRGAKIDAPYLSYMWFRGESLTNRPQLRTDKHGAALVPIPPLPDDRMQNFSIDVSATNYPGRAVMWVSDSGKVTATLPDSYTFKLKKGITIGGFVHDEHGQPLAGVTVIPWGSGYRGFSMGTGQQFHQEYAEAARAPGAGAVTDNRGFWKVGNFPADLAAVWVDVVRPGGARSLFYTPSGEMAVTVEEATPVSFTDLLSTNAVLEVKDGYNIHGIVVDQSGKAIPGVHLKARGGQVNQTPPYAFTNHPDGRFELSHWIMPQFVLTAVADGYAAKTIVLSSADSAAEKSVVLAPAKPLRVRVLGERDEPVGGARFVIIDWRSGNQILDWKSKTGADGRVVWTNAPDQPVSFWIQATNYPVRAAQFTADGTEKVVHLRQGSDRKISVRLTVTDAESGRPLPQFEVGRNVQWNQAFSPWGNPGSNGEFQAQVNASEFRPGIVDSFKLQVRGEGYLPWTSDWIYFEEGDQNLTVALTNGPAPSGIVRRPDGQPAADAKVILKLGDGAVFANAPDRYYAGQGSVTERTAADGSFHFQATDDDKYVIVTHPSGFASLTVGELRRTKEVRLQAWASVEGVLRVDGKPLANEYVDIKSPISWNALEGYNLVFMMRTDPEGRFVFSNLPPGGYVLYRQPHIIYGVQTIESHRLPFELQAGETKHIDYGFGGRLITGHVETTSSVDWQNDGQILAVKMPPPPPAPSYWSYVNAKDFEKARQAYGHSPELLNYERQQQQFQLVFDNEGNFQADDVPPGTYELRLRVTRPPEKPNQRFSGREQELGALVREVQVPAGTGTFDLGTLTMAVKPVPGQKAEPDRAVELSAKSLDGKPLTLQRFKGKYVLLAFWSSWSDRSTEQLAGLQKLQAELSPDKRLAFLGVSLDDNLEAVRETVKTRGYTWDQAWLDATNLAKASADFNVNSLPTVCLLDPEGHIIATGLVGDHARTAVEKALATK